VSDGGQSPRVLVVDDDERVAASLARLLARAGLEVVTACGAEEALASLAAGAFSVVVSDLQMPGRDGLWLLARVAERRPAVLRILVSGAKPELDGLTEGAPVDHFFPKPVDGARLAEIIRRWGEGG